MRSMTVYLTSNFVSLKSVLVPMTFCLLPLKHDFFYRMWMPTFFYYTVATKTG